jgi:hypothetical protein
MLPLELASFFTPLSGCPTHPLHFSRFALLGPYPVSTPLHLALAFLQRKCHLDAAQLETTKGPHVLLLQPSRHKFHASMVQENDEYLARHGGDPAIASLLESNLELRFLESMAAFTFFCSAHGSSEAGDVNSSLHLRQTPDLVIACNLSEYLLEKANIGCGGSNIGHGLRID